VNGLNDGRFRMATEASWLAIRLLERGLLPDRIVRAGIRNIVASRLREQEERDGRGRCDRRRRFVEERNAGPIAIATAAGQSHDEMPIAFYLNVLGPHLKYSSALWEPGVTSLEDAEARMLARTAARAGLADRQRVLDLGCGWGSLSLWMARRYPNSRIVGVSNSRSHKAWIDAQAGRERLANLEIVTADMNAFEAPGRFDRVVSVEMFEHMHNWRQLLSNIARWLDDDGQLFVQIFTGRHHAFAGDIMPAGDLLYEFTDIFTVTDHWRMPGTHYQKTARAWLDNLDRHREALWPILEDTYGRADARRWWVRWRVFFMACAELWGSREGRESIVSHYLLVKAPR